MKIAISTCNTGMVESLSAMFSEHEWHILGIMPVRPDWQFNMVVERQFGRNVYNHKQDEEPIEKINIRDYDLLIDVAESNDYNPEWREAAKKWDVPRIIYITNPSPETSFLRWAEKFGRLGVALYHRQNHVRHPIFQYYRGLKGYPTVFSNEQLRHDWGLDGEVIHFTADEWGIGGWNGDESRMLYGKNGYYTWSKPEGTRFEGLFSELEARLGSKLVIHDSSIESMSECDWRDYVAHKRVWFEHDFGSTGRAITQGLVKAMCLGLPVILWKTKICQGWRFIKNKVNGLVTNSVEDVVLFAKQLFYDYYLGKAYSENMVRAYRKHLSWDVAKPRWEKAMAEAFTCYEDKTK